MDDRSGRAGAGRPLADVVALKLPGELREWTLSALRYVASDDVLGGKPSLDWVVLLHPTLRLLQAADADAAVAAAATDTVQAFERRLRRDAVHVADLLLYVEVAAAGVQTDDTDDAKQKVTGDDDDNDDKDDAAVWRALSTALEAIADADGDDAVRDLLQLVCGPGASDELAFLVGEAQPQAAAEARGRRRSRVHRAWAQAVATYTHVARLHRLLHVHGDELSRRARAGLQAALARFDHGGLRATLRDLLPHVLAGCQAVVQDWAFVNYKALAMCTHSPTGVPPLYAAQVGGLQRAGAGPSTTYDMASWRAAFTAVDTMAREFEHQAAAVLSKRGGRLAAKHARWLRCLDNVCFVTTCLLLQAAAADSRADQAAVQTTRARVRLRVLALVRAGRLLDARTGKVEEAFCTYTRYEAYKWELHLLAGVFFLFWNVVDA